jgi:hypothetical protein
MEEIAERDAGTYALGSILLTVVAVGLFVAGIDLLVTCEASSSSPPFGGTIVTCSYPFQGFGATFLYAGALVGLAASAMFVQFTKLRGRKYEWDPRAAFGLAAAAITLCFVLGLLLGFI